MGVVLRSGKPVFGIEAPDSRFVSKFRGTAASPFLPEIDIIDLAFHMITAGSGHYEEIAGGEFINSIAAIIRRDTE